MGEYTEWLKRRRLREEADEQSDAADKFSFSNDDGMIADDHEKVQTELFKLVFSKYPTETLQFLDGIAQRGDEEVNSLIAKLKKGNEPAQFKEPRHPSDIDEIVPPEADSGQGGEFESD